MCVSKYISSNSIPLISNQYVCTLYIKPQNAVHIIYGKHAKTSKGTSLIYYICFKLVAIYSTVEFNFRFYFEPIKINIEFPVSSFCTLKRIIDNKICSMNKKRV